MDMDLNGVWNLVLTCQECNRVEHNGKFARVPHESLLNAYTSVMNILLKVMIRLKKQSK
ncbi:hypothetical protein [Bacillus wiedmannii]|uniref:hypothetical protein n=1 Tax=Bacillus wiedmannii TaxID=1890302 RepID=UPI0030EE0AB2